MRKVQYISVLTSVVGVVVVLLALGQEPAKPATEIDRWLEQLASPQFRVREQASDALVDAGEKVLPAVRERLKTAQELEVIVRCERIEYRIMQSLKQSKKVAGLELMPIPPGTFTMGYSGPAQQAPADEKQHEVTQTTYFLVGVSEVTQDQYKRVMGTNPSEYTPSGAMKDKVKDQPTGRFPIENVTWYDALAFCNALSQLDGYPAYYDISDITKQGGTISKATVKRLSGVGYCLPTEAEWEYACRAETTTTYNFGNYCSGKANGNFKCITSGGYGGTVENPSEGRPTRVKFYQPNLWKLYDFHGNVAEWCWDYYTARYDQLPTDIDPQGPNVGLHRVVRGGSWLVTSQYCTSAKRHMVLPSEAKDFIGFRVCRHP